MKSIIGRIGKPGGRQDNWLRFEIPLRACVHFSGIRFGNGLEHPFEAYLDGLNRGEPVQSARTRLVEFIRHYRPRHMGEALGVPGLEGNYPVWSYPWVRLKPDGAPLNAAWHARPEDCPDIMAHFSDRGIDSYRIDEQFYWLERAFRSIEGQGYRPEAHEDFVTVREYRKLDGSRAYLLLDGNHRVSAMAVLGYETLVVERREPDVIDEAGMAGWPSVKDGTFSPRDAGLLFDAYFSGNHQPRTTESPAPVIAPAGWLDLYGAATDASPAG